MDNPQKLASYVTQDEDRQNKNTTQYVLDTVPDLDKERPQANPLASPLPIPHLHDWRKMEACLINFNKGKDDEGCLKFCNILKWSATV